MDVSNGCGGNAPAEPQKWLCVRTPNDWSECAGVYALVEDERPNGHCLWKRVHGDTWLYSSPHMQWMIGGPSERNEQFKCSTAWIYCGTVHNGVLPHRVCGGWERWDGGKFLRDPDIAVTAAPNPDSAASEKGEPQHEDLPNGKILLESSSPQRTLTSNSKTIVQGSIAPGQSSRSTLQGTRARHDSRKAGIGHQHKQVESRANGTDVSRQRPSRSATTSGRCTNNGNNVNGAQNSSACSRGQGLRNSVSPPHTRRAFSDSTVKGSLHKFHADKPEKRSGILLERWMASQATQPANAVLVSYPNGIEINCAELAAASPSASGLEQASIQKAVLALESGTFAQAALEAYECSSTDENGCLSWHTDGGIEAFVSATFAECGIAVPSEDRLCKVCRAFDTNRHVSFDALGCLCLADALLRSELAQQQQSLSVSRRSVPRSNSHGRGVPRSRRLGGTQSQSEYFGRSGKEGPTSPSKVSQWSPQLVAQWATGVLGLPTEVGKQLILEEIHGSVLLTLTEGDLEILGISPFGRRRQLLIGIRGLVDQLTPSIASSPQRRTLDGKTPPPSTPLNSVGAGESAFGAKASPDSSGGATRSGTSPESSTPRTNSLQNNNQFASCRSGDSPATLDITVGQHTSSRDSSDAADNSSRPPPHEARPLAVTAGVVNLDSNSSPMRVQPPRQHGVMVSGGSAPLSALSGLPSGTSTPLRASAQQNGIKVVGQVPVAGQQSALHSGMQGLRGGAFGPPPVQLSQTATARPRSPSPALCHVPSRSGVATPMVLVPARSATVHRASVVQQQRHTTSVSSGTKLLSPRIVQNTLQQPGSGAFPAKSSIALPCHAAAGGQRSSK